MVERKYGFSWQIVPAALGGLMNDPEPEKPEIVILIMHKKNKIIIAEIKKPFDQ